MQKGESELKYTYMTESATEYKSESESETQNSEFRKQKTEFRKQKKNSEFRKPEKILRNFWGAKLGPLLLVYVSFPKVEKIVLKVQNY